ncbi:MAG TPA: hypothetical protein D7H88_03085, partial [Candidatus Poseidoniales archaeon]
MKEIDGVELSRASVNPPASRLYRFFNHPRGEMDSLCKSIQTVRLPVCRNGDQCFIWVGNSPSHKIPSLYFDVARQTISVII